LGRCCGQLCKPGRAGLSGGDCGGQGTGTGDCQPANKKQEATWVDESFNYTKSKVYKTPVKAKPDGGPFTLTTAYETKAKTLANQRVALAGARLANLINQELK